MSIHDSASIAPPVSPAALATALNEHSGTKRFRMIVCQGNGELRIFVEGATLPNKTQWLPKVCQLLRQVGLKTTAPIYLYGRQIGDILPRWQQRLAFNPASTNPATTRIQATAAAHSEPAAPTLTASSTARTRLLGQSEAAVKKTQRVAPSASQRSPLAQSPRSQSRQPQWSALQWGAIAAGAPVMVVLAAVGLRSLLPSSSTAVADGYALQFDGVDDIAIAPQSQLPDFVATEAGFSVSGWIYPTQFNRYGRIVERSDNDFDDRLILAVDHEKKGIHLNVNRNIAIATGLPLNEWSHVAGTYDGESIRVYINGELGAETPYEGAPLELTESDFWLGNNRQNTRPYAGYLKDIQLWQRALTSAEIQQALAQTPSAEAAELLASWPFAEETSDAAIADQVQKIPVTLQNATAPQTAAGGPQVVQSP